MVFPKILVTSFSPGCASAELAVVSLQSSSNVGRLTGQDWLPHNSYFDPPRPPFFGAPLPDLPPFFPPFFPPFVPLC
jgi:hypothetical protein